MNEQSPMRNLLRKSTGKPPVASSAPTSTPNSSSTAPAALVEKPKYEECHFERISQVGEGTYGKVYKARHLQTGDLVALKRIRLEMDKEGFPLTAMRETRLLQRVNHPNVLNLQDIIYSKGCVYMVFEYLEYDLNGILAHPAHHYQPEHVKCLLQQMLNGLDYLHRRGILHRDIKGSNILINKKGQLKLADFGLARLYSHQRQDCTNRVITMWYRPPELLLGATDYGPEVDIWGIGCLFLEMFIRKPLFPGNDEISQLNVIYKLCGTPSLKEWPEIQDLPWYNLIKSRKDYPRILHESFQNILTEEGYKLVRAMLALNPEKRISADDALKSSYFYESPAACSPEQLPTPEGDWHEFESKMRRKRSIPPQPPSQVSSRRQSGVSDIPGNSKRVKI